MLTTYTLPKEAWVKGYYDLLEPRAKALLHHPDQSVRDFAVGTVKEIDIFNRSEESYGYVFMYCNAYDIRFGKRHSCVLSMDQSSTCR